VAQYDVFRPTGSSVLVVDCQSRALEHLPTRFTVALLPLGNSPIPAAILNPILTLDAEEYQFAPQFAATLSLTELGVDRERALSAARCDRLARGQRLT
jgi:hypothetical protein